MPLGDVWSGECRAPGAQGAVPDRHALLECCNLGYARGKCGRFSGAGPDAVRFAVTDHAAGVVSLCCIIEKEYLPFGRAALDWDIAERRFLSPPPDQGTGRQAWAYVASYLARKQLA